MTAVDQDGIGHSVDLSDLAFWRRPVGERDAVFRHLRSQKYPVRYREPRRPGGPDNCFYALVRHGDVLVASRQPAIFSSAQEGATPRVPTDYAAYFKSMINMDDPQHLRLRRIVARAFTPRMVGHITDFISSTARKIVDDLVDRGPCDFVAQVAAPMPLRVICEIVGVPESHRKFVLERSNAVLSGFDPEYAATPRDAPAILLGAVHDLYALAESLAGDRRRHPADDLTSRLVHANLDGERLTAAEIGSFFILLIVAGNETTRHAISQGLMLLTEHLDQRALLLRDFDRYAVSAVDEIVRIASPVTFMARQLTRDYKVRGTILRAGERVRLYYRSANRDESVFRNPDTFDITRTLNPHVGFGGPGPHLCLGTHLARTEIKAVFRELLRRLPGVRAVGKPDFLLSSFINGVKRLPCEPH